MTGFVIARRERRWWLTLWDDNTAREVYNVKPPERPSRPCEAVEVVPADQLAGAVDAALRDVLEEAKRRMPQLTGDQLTGDRIAMTIGYVVIDRLRGQ
jgi:hypothetical protein